jgi:predicted GNAT family acetyltransferase
LTALVYPEFFRPRTVTLGTYLGIYVDGRLASMVGERMRIDGYQELSAVCTHPDYTGRGYAARLLAELVNASFDRGAIPFLHVGRGNDRARALYERLGFRERIDVGLWSVRRS